MTQIIYSVLHINYQKKNNNNKNKKMQNFLTSIVGQFKGPLKRPTIVGLNSSLKVIGLINIQQIKKVFSKINS